MFQKFPLVRQHDQKECGICCLLMIIRYYHGNYSLRELQKLTHTTEKGVTAYQLIEAGKEIGFNARGVACENMLKMKHEVFTPCIAHINVECGGHYVVIYKISFSKKVVWIADPAKGFTKASFSSFEKQWSKVLLLFYPQKKIDFHKEKHVLSFFLNYILTDRKMIWQLFFLSLAITLLSIGTSFYLKLMVEFLSKHRESYLLYCLILFFIILYTFRDISHFCRNHLISYLNRKMNVRLFLETFEHLLHLPYIYYRNKTTGDIMNRINDMIRLKNTFIDFILVLFVDSLLCIISIFFLFMIHQTLGISVLITVLLYFTFHFCFQPWLKKQLYILKQDQSHLSSFITENILGMESTKGLFLEDQQQAKLEQALLSVVQTNFSLEKKFHIKDFVISLIKNLAYCGILGGQVYLIYQQKLSIGSIFLSQSLISFIFDPLDHMIQLELELKDAETSLERLLDLFIEQKKETSFNQLTLTHIRLKKVTYLRYQKRILSDISLSIHHGEHILLMGSSGSGKSTLLKLFMNYYEPSSGQILFNNISIHHFHSSALKGNLSYLSQKELLFTTTLMDNIVMGRDYEEETLKQVIQLCEVDKIVSKNPLGYQMFIEEDGFNLSGGEKQRILLARHLLCPAHFILIDEGFSQMDTNLERRILKNMFDHYKDKTFIIVSHRFDNLDLFDRKIQLRNGKIIQDVSK